MLAIRTVLHPTDFSESSAAAFRLACALVRDYGAKLVVLHAYPAPVTLDDAAARRLAGEPEKSLTEKLHAIQPNEPGHPVIHLLVEGRPADTILGVAAEVSADLIVMGTHGRFGLLRLLMGSVAEAVMREAPCPVATVRPSVRAVDSAAESESNSHEIGVPVGPFACPVILRAALRWSRKPRGIVVFADGTGATRQNLGCRYVAADLTGAGFATLTLDLLTEAEGKCHYPAFDVKLLADRLAEVAGWLTTEPELTGLPVGLFATGTAGAAALLAAARHPDRITAVVSCGGRPDLVWDDLPAVHAPALLVVGAEDEQALGWNRDALWHLPYPKDMAVIPGANELDAESPARAQVVDLARAWFAQHLRAGAKVAAGL